MKVDNRMLIKFKEMAIWANQLRLQLGALQNKLREVLKNASRNTGLVDETAFANLANERLVSY